MPQVWCGSGKAPLCFCKVELLSVSLSFGHKLGKTKEGKGASTVQMSQSELTKALRKVLGGWTFNM
jgi:hypothetical protein